MFLDTRTICLKLFDMTIIANHRSSVYVSHNASDCIFCQDARRIVKGFIQAGLASSKFIILFSIIPSWIRKPCDRLYLHIAPQLLDGRPSVWSHDISLTAACPCASHDVVLTAAHLCTSWHDSSPYGFVPQRSHKVFLTNSRASFEGSVTITLGGAVVSVL